MCEIVALKYPENLQIVPNHFKAQEMHEKVLDNFTYMLEHIPDCYKTQDMCKSFVLWEPFMLQY